MVERRRSSGLTIQAFCGAENINVATYYYWHQRLKLKESEETPTLIPISIEKQGQQCESNRENLELTYPNAVHRETESEGSWRQSSGSRNTNIIRHIRWGEFAKQNETQ